MSTQPEVWRVNTVEGIFETDLETLKQWIVEGCVLPTDKVTKGSQGWIEAGRVPKLKGAFAGEVATAAEPASNSFAGFADPTAAVRNSSGHSTTAHIEPARVASSHANVCQNHPEAEPDYVCRMCGALFCKACPRFVSGNVPVCPSCGDLCHEYRAEVQKSERVRLQGSGFGMEDFVRAVGYPFSHKAALIGGALIYAILLFAGFRGRAIASVFLFGCISHVISQVAWGRLNRSFMPDFSAFSLWDDLIQPGFLGVGIMIVSWGPAIALVLVLIFGVVGVGSVASSATGANQPAAPAGPTHEDLAVLTDPNADPAKLEEANKKLQELQPGAQIAHAAEESKAEAVDPARPLKDLMPYLFAKMWIALLFLVFIGWGIFYYPMALTVAGYTQSFGDVINPIVGLDTIRRMGLTYFKAFAMVILVQIVAIAVGVVITIITAPLALPFMGNLADSLISATFTFYFNLVIACILGLSLFKCADRLGISVD